ncbi:unnamed protein product [Mytilus coruscus]|uniref:Uncharacterized protein n=1 Tax=Mytilus coruscus TaxID=42192 RepID=A0A6J8F508_MYTCO|nr:unnamed protein product [Mytilus coruscus]
MYREFLKKLAVTDTRLLRDETSLKKSGHGYFFIPKTLHNNIYSSFMSAESARKKLREKLKSDPVIWGTVATELQPSDKVVRLFIYGTSEYEHECNRLLETCCRNIKQICKQQGYEFQIVCDSICGIQNEAITDHMTPEIFHQEVTEKLPLDLNFMLLFSPSCGKPSLPRHIPEKEFELIQDKVESSECKQLLSKWYVKDENSVPPKYILQPIATHLPEIISQDGSKKMAATRQWKKESESLLEELLSAAEKALSQEEANGLKLSVTHVDVVSDIVNSGQLVMKKCLWLKPNTTDIKEQELSTLTDSFRNEKLKTSITDLLKDLTTELAKQLPAGNILSYDTTKHEKGVNPANKVQMVDKMVKGVERKLKQMINEAIKKRQLYSIKSPLYDESLQHLLYCQSKYKNFQGNKDVIERMRKYVLDTSKKTCKFRIIHGAPGSGKTFVMSMIAAKASEWWTKKKRGNIPVIMRFVRLTPGSSNLLDLLQSIIDEIRTIHDREQQASPKGFKEIIAAFEQTLNSTTKTMVILIDGVDQLDPGFNLTKSKFWIPQSIRSNIRFILSTTDNEFFSILKEKLPEECFIPVISTKTDLTSILNHSLMKNKRKLTTSQQDLLMNSFNDGCVPLHLNLCISEALKWTSYMDMSNIQIKETIKDAIHSLFEELEVCHGQIFVSRALGYLTASKKGLSEAELEDILSCDNAVFYFVAKKGLSEAELKDILSCDNAVFYFVAKKGLSEAELEDILSCDNAVFHFVAKKSLSEAELEDILSCDNAVFYFVAKKGLSEAELEDILSCDNAVFYFVAKKSLSEAELEDILSCDNAVFYFVAKKGLSEAELEDILSCDNDVLNEVFVDKILAGQRFTSLLLIRLLCDMEQFTVVRELEGGMVTTWCNKVVKDIAEDRYCKDRTSLHGRLSDYFSGTMAYDHKKPFVNRNDGKDSTDRYVASQPIKYDSTYNGRKLGNLPYHLIMNGNISRLKEECLLNVEFLTSKLDYSSFRSVQEDFELARRQTDDRQIDLVFEALLLSQKALEINPKLFVQQMYLRLADVKETEEFSQLCRKVNINYLCPNTNVLFKVGSPLVYDFSNSIVDVNSFDLMQNGNMAVLCCRLRHIELWNIKNYCLVKRIEGVVSNNRKDVYKYVHSVVDDTLILVQVISCDFIAMNHIGEQIYSIPVEKLYHIVYVMEVFLYNLQTGEKITDIEISCSPTEKNAGFARRLCYGDLDIDSKATICLLMGKNVLFWWKECFFVVDLETGFRQTLFRNAEYILDVQSVDMENFFTVSKLKEFDGRDFKKWSISKRSNPGEITQYLGKTHFHVMPNSRYALVIVETKKMKKMMVYDFMDKKIVSEANINALPQSLVFIDDMRAVMNFSGYCDVYGLHLIDLKEMKETPIQGEMYDSVPVVMVKLWQRICNSKRNGKHLKFYNMKTHKATDILKFPDTMRSYIGSKNYAIALSCRRLDIWVVDIVRKTAYKSGILQPFIPPRNEKKIDNSHQNTDKEIDNSSVNTDKEIDNSSVNTDKEIDKSNDNIDKDNNKIDEEEEDDDDEDEEEEEEDDDDEDEETLYYIKNVAITTDEKHIVASNKKNRNLHLIDIKTFETSKSLLGDLDIDSKAYHMSPDGKKMYYSGGKSLFVVDLETGFRQTLFRNAEYILDVQSVDMENFFTVSKLKEFDGRDFKKWSISKRSNPGEITQYLGKTVSIFHVMPNSRYALVIVETKKMKKMMVYDSMDKKIVSEANINALPQSLVFIDDMRAVMNFSGYCDVYGLHLIDLKEMKETPIQGEMYDSVPVVMVNYGKEYVTATRNGKHLKFYNMKTHKATDILKFPDTMRSYIGDYIATNANGTMMSILMQASSSYFNNLKVVVIDVETRKIIKILISGRLDSDSDSFAETMLLPNNGSFIAVAGNNENDEWIMYLWDLSQDKLRKVLVDPEYNLDRLYSTSVNYENQQAVLLDDDRILTNHQDDLLRLWATQNGSLLARIPGHRSSFPVMYHVPQSPFILTYCESENQMMRLWDKKTFEEIAAFRLDEPVDNIEWCKDGMTFLTFSSEPVVLTKWTIEGPRIPDKSLNYPPAFDEKGLVTEKNLVIKKVITDPDDLDQEEDEEDSDSDIDPEFDDEDDDDEEDDEDDEDEDDDDE